MSRIELINGETSVLFRTQINHFAFCSRVFFIKLKFEPLSKEFGQSHIDQYSRAVKFFNPLTELMSSIHSNFYRCSSTHEHVLLHVSRGLPRSLPALIKVFHSIAFLAIHFSSLRRVWPIHPHFWRYNIHRFHICSL